MARLRTSYVRDENGRLRRGDPARDADIGPAAAGDVNGLAALGRLSATKAVGTPDPLEQSEHAAGFGPIERRRATAAELARLEGPPVAVAPRPGPAMHVLRPAGAVMAASRQRGTQRHIQVLAARAASRPAQDSTGDGSSTRPRAEGMPAPAGVPVAAPTHTPRQEETVTATTTQPDSGLPELPCTSCIHAVVCRLQPVLAAAMYAVAKVTTDVEDPAVRIRSSVECDHHAPSTTAAGTLTRLLDERAALEAAAEPVPAPVRIREAPASELAERPRYPLPKDRDERDRVVLEAIRTTPTMADAATKLGVSVERVRQITGEMRVLGRMPDDVAEVLRARGRRGKGVELQPEAVAS